LLHVRTQNSVNLERISSGTHKGRFQHKRGGCGAAFFERISMIGRPFKTNVRVIAAVATVVALTITGWVFAQQNQSAQPQAPQSPAAQPGAGAPKAGPGGPGAGGPPGANAPIAVEVATVKPANVNDDVSAVGTLRANESVIVRPEISGRISRLHFQEGQTVKRGQVLVSLDASVLAAEIAQAKAELALSRNNFRRTEELAAKEFVSERAKDEAAANLQVQEAKIALAEARLAKSTIRAPFDGRIGLRQVAVGDYVREGADMFSIEDTANIKVDFRLPERYLSSVKGGQRIVVGTDALPGKEFAAQVDLVDPLVDSNTRSFLVRGKIANTQGALRPGMFARVRLTLDNREGVLMVPEEAVTLTPTQGSNASFVFKVANGRAIRTRVETGARRNAQVEIKSGLAAGDLVVTAGQIKIRGNEAPVRVLQATATPQPGGAGAAGASGGPAAPASAAPPAAKS
jgi:membrane fusion protein, multidrug efflux system